MSFSLSDLTKPEFEPDEEWLQAFQEAYLEAMVSRGIGVSSARVYATAVVPALRLMLRNGTSILDADFPSQWAISLTPSARKLFSAGWAALAAWLRLALGLHLSTSLAMDPLGHPPQIRRAAIDLLGATDGAPPLPRHLAGITWGDVHWGTGELRLPGRSHRSQYGAPKDPIGLLRILNWVLNPVDPDPPPAGHRFGLEGSALVQAQRVVRRLLGPLWDGPVVPVFPGSRVPVSSGVIHVWLRKYAPEAVARGD